MLSSFCIRAEKQTWGKWAKKPTQESHGLALCLLGCAFWFQVCSYGTWSASSERRSLYRDSTPTYIVPDSDIAIVLEKGKVRFSCILIYIYIYVWIYGEAWNGLGLGNETEDGCILTCSFPECGNFLLKSNCFLVFRNLWR